MKVAEELYQQGFISYPRTETDSFSAEMAQTLHDCIRGQEGDPRWGGYAQSLSNGGFHQPRAGGHDDKAHPPIYPIKAALPADTAGWAVRKRQMYEFVVRHFLACCSAPAVGQATEVGIDIAGEGFTARGLMIANRRAGKIAAAALPRSMPHSFFAYSLPLSLCLPPALPSLTLRIRGPLIPLYPPLHPHVYIQGLFEYLRRRPGPPIRLRLVGRQRESSDLPRRGAV